MDRMTSQCFHRLATLSLLLVAGGCGSSIPPGSKDAEKNPPAIRFQFTHPALGTRFRVVIYCEDGQSVALAEQTVIRQLAELEEVFDPDRPSSEVSRIYANAGIGAVRVSDGLYRLLKQADRLAKNTGGAFDITAGSAAELWRRCAGEKRLPSADEVEKVRAVVGSEKLQLNAIARTVGLAEANMRFDFSGVLSGYACDRVLTALAQAGLASALVESDGCIAVGDPPPRCEHWWVEMVDAPPKSEHRLVQIRRRSIATSSRLADAVEIDARSFLPIVNPLTGVGSRNVASVTVAAPRAWQAAALARAAAVLGSADGRTLIRAHPGVRAWFHNPAGTADSAGEKPEAINGPAVIEFPNSRTDKPADDAEMPPETRPAATPFDPRVIRRQSTGR